MEKPIRITIVLEGGADKAIGVLRNPHAAEITANALDMLWLLLAETEAVRAARTPLEDAVLLVMGAMLCHKKDERVSGYGCRTLCALMRLDQKNAVTIMQSDGIRLIVESMAQHRNSAHCACRAAEAIGLLAHNGDNVRAIVRHDGILRLMASMATHQTVGLQTHCLQALQAMAPQFVDDTSLEEQADMFGGLLVERVLAAMTTHADNAEVHELGALVLAEVGRSTFFQELLLGTDGCEGILLASLTKHQTDHNAEAAIQALRRLLPKLAKLEVSDRQGMVRQLLQAMKMHPGRRVLQAASCSMLWQLVKLEQDPGLQRSLLAVLAEAGGQGIVQLALQTHSDSASVLEHVFLLLGTLAAADLSGGRSEICQNGGVGAILAAVLGYQRQHAGVPLSVLRACCSCLGVLGAGDELAQAALLDAGGAAAPSQRSDPECRW
eukprot:SAG22_NODE_289_length_12942_cov_6.674531_2_plen_438_part_00